MRFQVTFPTPARGALRMLLPFCLIVFTSKLLAGIAPVLLNGAPAPPRRPLPVKMVFAHYMVCCPTAGGGATVEDFKHEIQEAQSRGIDGFALNCGGWNKSEPHYKVRTLEIYEAARRLGTGFQLFISADGAAQNEIED